MNRYFERKTRDARNDFIKRDRLLTREVCFSLAEFRQWALSKSNGHGIWQCTYCGLYLSELDLEFDHDTPLALGGETALANLVIACGRCNRMKGSVDGRHFRQLREFLAAWPDAQRKSIETRLASRPQWRPAGNKKGAAQAILDNARSRGLVK